jgi:hypothetical protein
MHKFYCLMSLLQDNLDDLQVTTLMRKLFNPNLENYEYLQHSTRLPISHK